MKIGVLTYFYAYNYGAMLQAYALMTVLRKLGHEVVFIDYRAPWSKQFSFGRLSSYLARTPRNSVKKLARMYRLIFAHHKFRQMARAFPRTPRYYRFSLKALQANPPQCDAYIAGSDQVWNCGGWLGNAEAYFLPFGPEKVRRIAYAASLGGSPIPNAAVDKVRGYLRAFHAISVREKSSVGYLASLGIPDVEWMPDPTLLLSPDDYAPLQKMGSEVVAEGVVYVLHAGGQEMQRLVKACTTTCKTVLNIALDEFRVDEGINKVVSVPDFLRAIAQAQRVITTSFHCAVFSILFHRPFVVIRLQGPRAGMNARLESFLTEFDLLEHFVDALDVDRALAALCRPINWQAVDAKVDQIRKRGWQFLSKALTDEGAPLP